MTSQELAQVIEKHDQQWLLEGRPQEKLDFLLRKFHDACSIFQEQFADTDENGIVLNDQTLRLEPESKIRTLLQTLTYHSPEFIAGIWRIIQGDRIASISMGYRSLDSFELRVALEGEHDRKRREMRSIQIEDAAFLRHLPFGRVGDKPFFVGYFPMCLPK